MVIKNILKFLPVILFLTNIALKSETYNIKDFGAVADGKTINTEAIQKAIYKCNQNGGGIVLIPAGTFISGTIQLFSNIDLFLERGAILKGSNKVSDYYLNGKKLGLIYTENSDNISISGEGNIDGNGDAFMNLNEAKVFDSVSTKYTRQKNQFRQVLKGLGDGPLVPLDRPFQMIIFSNCKNVTLKNILVTNSPFWTIHFADCDGVIVSGVRVWNNLLIPNNDGIDLTSCRNVQISDCDIRTGDDAFAITGYAYHFDLPGYKNIMHISKNITITNCYLVSRSSAIRVGGWDQNDMQNYTFDNIVIDSSNRGINLCVRDQGSIKDMIFSNIIINTKMHTGDWWGNGEPIHISAIRGKDSVKLGKIENIKFSNIIAKGESGILLYCSNESEVKNISFNDISFALNESKLNSVCGGNFDLRPTTDPKFALFSHNISAFYAENVKDIEIQNFDLKWGDVKESYFTNGIEFKNFKDISIDRYTGDPAPFNKTAAAICLKDGEGYRITNSFTSKTEKKFLIKENVK